MCVCNAYIYIYLYFLVLPMTLLHLYLQSCDIRLVVHAQILYIEYDYLCDRSIYHNPSCTIT